MSLNRHVFAAAAFALAIAAVLARPAAAEVPRILAGAAPSERAQFELYFPPRDRTGLQALIEAQNRPDSPIYHQWLTPQQFARSFGPTPATLAQVTAELAARGLRVTEARGQMLRVAGTAAAVESAFGIRLFHARFADGSQRLVADRPLRMPRAIAASGALTPEFSTAPSQHTDSEIVGRAPRNFHSTTGPYFAFDLRQAYDYPSAASLTAKGVNIGILMAGNDKPTDLATYFSEDGLTGSNVPSVVSVPVDGGLAFSANNSEETELDIEQSGGVSLGASIRLYDLSDLSFATTIYGLEHIVSDNISDVVNMSFGANEAALTAAENNGVSLFYILSIYDILFAQGTSQGQTFVASSGDHGAIPLVGGTPTLSVEAPASDPFVVSVGGTNLVTTHTANSYNSAYVSENAGFDFEPGGEVWGSGGGLSIVWAKPSYQTLVPTPSTAVRTVPDVALHMGGCPNGATTCNSPDSSDYEFLNGTTVETIGTSAAAPDITGLLALKKKLTGKRLGLENTDIYTRSKNQIAGHGTPFHHKGINGDNGHYTTKVPYDLVIGNGTVDGRQLLGTTLPAAGIPHTASNP
jgi:subtilase family serine protease